MYMGKIFSGTYRRKSWVKATAQAKMVTKSLTQVIFVQDTTNSIYGTVVHQV